jgi:hypothetical protein
LKAVFGAAARLPLYHYTGWRSVPERMKISFIGSCAGVLISHLLLNVCKFRLRFLSQRRA